MEDIVVRALQRSEIAEEPKPERCIEVGCKRLASRSDGHCAKHSAVRLTTPEVKRAAREILERNAVSYARLHLAAAKMAAIKGDAEPAERGLLLGRAIEPLKRDEGGSGVIVNIGVVLPNCRE